MPLVPYDEPAWAVADLARRCIAEDEEVGERSPAQSAPAERARIEGTVSLETALATRVSVRQFSSRRPTAPILRQVLDAATELHRWQWPAVRHSTAELSMLIGAYDIDGLELGLHRRRNDTGSLEPVNAPTWLSEVRRRYAPAPAIIWVCGQLTAPSSSGGLLVRVGSLGYSIWLAALSHGMDGTVFGSTSDEVTRASRALVPESRHLFTVALGYRDAGQEAAT